MDNAREKATPPGVAIFVDWHKAMSVRKFVFAFLVSALLPNAAAAARPPLLVPSSASAVIEQLPRGYALLAPRKQTLPALRVADVERMLAVAARTGDARLATRAQALLDRIPVTDASPPVIRAKAFSAQHRHDFPAALRLLDSLVAQQPRDGDARLARAQIHLVQGRLDLARADCAALALGVDSGRGLICIAALSLRQGRLPQAASVSERWLAQASPGDPSRLFVLLMRGEIASRSGAGDAMSWFGQALALAPDDVRVLAATSRHLRRAGRHAEVLKLLVNASSEGLQLERALAARAAGVPQAQALADAQARRYRLAHVMGSAPEMRDEAELLLTLRGDSAAALVLALRNFGQQRDYEDVDLLQRAAHAAGRPDALGGMQAWATSQKLDLGGDAAAWR